MKESTEKSKTTFRKDKEWKAVEGQLCLVEDFQPMAGSKVVNDEVSSPQKNVPYASLTLVIKRNSDKITGFVTHKLDFQHLWEAFQNRQIDHEKEEVLIYWTTKHYKYSVARIISSIMLTIFGGTNLPKMIVMVCPKGTFKSVEEFSLKDGHKVLIFVHGLMSIQWWVPDVIE